MHPLVQLHFISLNDSNFLILPFGLRRLYSFENVWQLFRLPSSRQVVLVLFIS